MSQKPSMSLILIYGSVVIITNCKGASLPIAATGSMDHGHQHDLQQQRRSQTSTWPLATTQTMDMDTACSDSMDHGCQPRKRTVFLSDILLLLRVRVTVWLDSMFRDGTCKSSRLLYPTPPLAPGYPGIATMFAACGQGCPPRLSSPQQGKQFKKQQQWHLRAAGWP